MGDRALALEFCGKGVSGSGVVEVDCAGAGGVRVGAEHDFGCVQRARRHDQLCADGGPDIERALLADRDGTTAAGDRNGSAVPDREHAWSLVADEELGSDVPAGGRG